MLQLIFLIWNYTCSASFFILYMVQGTFQYQCVCFLSDSCISSASSCFTFSFHETKWLLKLWVWYAWTVKSGYQILFCTQKSNLALIKMPNFKYMAVLFDFGDHFPWHTQFAQYTWLQRDRTVLTDWRKLSVTLTSDTDMVLITSVQEKRLCQKRYF